MWVDPADVCDTLGLSPPVAAALDEAVRTVKDSVAGRPEMRVEKLGSGSGDLDVSGDDVFLLESIEVEPTGAAPCV